MKTKMMARASVAAMSLCAVLYGLNACDDDTEIKPTNDGGALADVSPQETSTQDVTTPPPAEAGTQDITIRFKAKVGTQDFACGTAYANQGTPATMVEPADLRFFVQDVQLIDSTGGLTPVTIAARSPWQIAGAVALLDFENGTAGCANGNPDLNDIVTGTVPAGKTYTGIAFRNGVPATLNHQDPATSPPPLTAGGMTWGWLSGHIFIKAEVKGANDAGGLGLFHLGSVGCTNELGPDGGNDNSKGPAQACRQGNRNEVRFTTFNTKANVIVFDVASLFATTDLAAQSRCHSGGPNCPPMFASVGLDFDGGAPMGTHAAFRVE